MDKMINALISIDRQARDMVENADGYMKSTMENLSKDVQALRSEYVEKATRRINIIKEQEVATAKESFGTMQEHYVHLMEILEQSYQKNHARLEAEIFQRCIGGE